MRQLAVLGLSKLDMWVLYFFLAGKSFRKGVRAGGRDLMAYIFTYSCRYKLCVCACACVCVCVLVH